MTGDFKNRDVTTKPLNKKEKKFLYETRKSDVVWLTDPWIYRLIHPVIREANKRTGWNYQWDFSENNQFTIYNKGQYYGWHSDGWVHPYNSPEDPGKHGKIRKLSSTILLNDASEFKGGEFEFDYRNTVEESKHKVTELTEAGDMIIFPSYIWHRVNPVKSGTRYSLVSWHLGWPFK